MAETPFDSIESAHEYVSLLVQQVEEVAASLAEDLEQAASQGASRHLDALRLVDYKLRQLEHHLSRSRRILNDLRALRRLLLADRDPAGAAAFERSSEPPAEPVRGLAVESLVEAFAETALMEDAAAVPLPNLPPKRDA
jgi:hypothetical protein